MMAIVWEKFPFPLPRPNEGERYRTVKGIAGVMRRLMRGLLPPSQIFHANDENLFNWKDAHGNLKDVVHDMRAFNIGLEISR